MILALCARDFCMILMVLVTSMKPISVRIFDFR